MVFYELCMLVVWLCFGLEMIEIVEIDGVCLKYLEGMDNDI